MKSEIILYRPDELAEHIEVRINEETVWLSQEQIVQLFQRDQSVISRHIRNVFNEGELDEKSNMQKMHIANSDKLIALQNLWFMRQLGREYSNVKQPASDLENIKKIASCVQWQSAEQFQQILIAGSEELP